MNYEIIYHKFKDTGFLLRGGFHPHASDDLPDWETVVMVGNAGPEMWQEFKTAVTEKTRLSNANPLDHWTQGIILKMAGELGASALFPFQGPPYYPFQQWATRSGPVNPSPLGILMHPQYGLWHGYRAALGFKEKFSIPERPKFKNPCDSCVDKPCLNTCPVAAYSDNGLDVGKCVGHINQIPAVACMGHNCLARLACPVGRDWIYEKDHGNFHMVKFLQAQSGNGKVKQH